MANEKIEKIYDLSLLGAEDVIRDMDRVNESYDRAKKTFLSLKDVVKTTQSASRAEYEKSRIELLKQQTAQKNLRAETIAYNNVLNAQKLASKQAAESTKFVAGSYEDLRLKAKALRAELKNNLVIAGVDSKKVTQGTAELKKLVAQMQVFDRSLSRDGTLVGEYTSGINKAFSQLGRNLTQFVLGFVGFQAILQGVANVKTLADESSDLQVNLGKSADAVADLTAELAALNTRTKLTELQGIANIAAKAGVAPENIVGVTKALDQIKIAFGEDFGDVELGTETLVKLINIFEGKENVTEQNLLKVGNAIRVLANESVASVPFLNDFAQRMAGLEGIFTNFKIEQVLGIASAFEQEGQSAETTSTALIRILPAMAKNADKFAEIVGITKKQFTELLNNNPAEALLQLSEALVNGKGNVVDVVTALGETGIGATRVTTALGILGSKTDVFRHSIETASAAIQNTDNITESFRLKNENLAATLDKISKKFSDAANNEGFKTLVSSTAGVILFFIKVLTAIPFGLIIGGLTVLTASWAYYKGQVISTTLASKWNNDQTLIGIVRRAAERLGLIAVTQARRAETAATVGQTVAQEGLNVAQKASPLGLILAGIALLLPLIAAYGSTTDDTTEAIDEQNLSQAEQNRLLKERQEIAEKISAELAKQQGAVVKDGKITGGKFKGEVGIDREAFNKATGVDKAIEKVNVEAKKQEDILFPINIPLLKEQIKGYNEQIDAFKGTQKDLDKLIIARKKAQDQLNDILGKENKEDKKAAKDAQKAEQDRIAENIRQEKGRAKDREDRQKTQDAFQIKILQDNETHRSNELKELQIFFSKERKIILENTKLTDEQRKAQLKNLDDAEQRTLLSAEVLLLADEVKEKKKLYDRSEANDKDHLQKEADYLEAMARLTGKQAQLQGVLNDQKKIPDRRFITPSSGNTQNKITDLVIKNQKITTEEEKGLAGNVVAQSYDIATLAMNTYFDLEAQRIEDSKRRRLSTLDTEEKIALSKAATKADEERITKQFEQRRIQIEKEAFEEMKKIRKAEISIAFATELANIAVAAAANPANPFTAGGAGALQYAILAGIASARFALNLKSVNAQKFTRGGKVPLRGGEISGESHERGGVPFSGKEFEAEGRELAIINKKSAASNQKYTITGTPKQIASRVNTIGGGVAFAPGATTYKFAQGGYFGSAVQPPVFQSYYQNSTSQATQQNDYTELKDMIKDLIGTVYAESVKPVVLNPSAVTDYQHEAVRRAKIGEL